MQQEAALKKQLMEFEFELNQKIQEQQRELASRTEAMKEDRKDRRTQMQASNQSQLIEQKKAGTPPKRFESAGNDELGTGAGIDIGGLAGQ